MIFISCDECTHNGDCPIQTDLIEIGMKQEIGVEGCPYGDKE